MQPLNGFGYQIQSLQISFERILNEGVNAML